MTATDEPKLKRDWIGRKVRALRELRNGFVVIPANAILEVTENRSGLSLTGPTCACCGVRPFIRRVSMFDVELLPKDADERDVLAGRLPAARERT